MSTPLNTTVGIMMGTKWPCANYSQGGKGTRNYSVAIAAIISEHVSEVSARSVGIFLLWKATFPRKGAGFNNRTDRKR